MICASCTSKTADQCDPNSSSLHQSGLQKKGAACSVRDGMHGRTMDLKGVIPAPWGQSLPIVVHRCPIIWLTFLLFFYRLFGGF